MIKAPHSRRFLFTLLIFCLFISGAAFAAVPKITNVRISDSAEMTRFVFDLSGPINDYHVSYHPSGERLTLDINNLSLTTALPKLILKNTPVSNYASYVPSKNKLRLNFELNRVIEPNVFTLKPSGKYSDRLVLDLKKQVSITTGSVPAIQGRNAMPERSTTTLTPQLVSPKKPTTRPIMIVIDPGHGGKDPGAIGKGKNREKTVVLEISKTLRDLFNKERGYQAELTRDRDVYLPLRTRLDIARKHKADLFISIHADAYKNPSVKGASVFALSDRGATSEMARWIAQKENESELLDGVHASNDKVLRSVLLDLSQTYAISTSLDIGGNILKRLGAMTHLHSKRVEQAAFVVLKSPDIPSLLIETGFISNPTQEKELISKSYQKKISEMIVRGVKDYFNKYPPQNR
jgi:N-acetylmuramoyl-L-alanine amidase